MTGRDMEESKADTYNGLSAECCERCEWCAPLLRYMTAFLQAISSASTEQVRGMIAAGIDVNADDVAIPIQVRELPAVNSGPFFIKLINFQIAVMARSKRVWAQRAPPPLPVRCGHGCPCAVPVCCAHMC